MMRICGTSFAGPRIVCVMTSMATMLLCAACASDRPVTSPAGVALDHGRDQLRRMIEDRPVMALHVRPEDEIWNWAARAFAGAETGFLVYWERASPASGGEANHTYPRPGQVALIRIRPLPDPTTVSFERAWSCFVYEILNLKSASAYWSIHEGVLRGRVDRDGYVDGNSRLEFLAIEETRRFHAETWAPWCVSQGIASVPRLWYVGGAASYGEWLGTPGGRRTREFWANSFDRKFADRGALQGDPDDRRPRSERWSDPR